MKIFKSYAAITFGMVLYAVGVYFFIIPNGFSTGGISGLGTVLGKVFSVSPVNIITILNILCLLSGFVILGKETGFKTAYCSVLFSLFTKLFEILIPLDSPLTDQPLLELIYAMMLTSLGSAMIFRCHASSGGTDIIALIIKKFFRLNVGKALFCADFLIAVSSFYVFGIQVGLFSILGLFTKAFLVDSIIENLDVCKYFAIVTKKPDEISDYIMNEFHHSATLVEAKGTYSGEETKMLHTVCKRFEALKLQKKVKEIDPTAFMIITSSSEIIGNGFREI